MKIVAVSGHEVYDARGWPTIMCALTLEDEHVVYGYAPGGFAGSQYEAYRIHDSDNKRLWGHGVLKAVGLIHDIIGPFLCGKEPQVIELDAGLLDLDGSDDLSYLGANTLFAVSIAICKAQAYVHKIQPYELMGYLYGAESVTLPFPFFQMIHGGIHGDNELLIQEFMVVPVAATSFRESMEVGAIVFHELKNLLLKKGYATCTGDTGSFGVGIPSDHHALEFLTQVLEKVATHENSRCVIALDIAANNLYDKMTKTYRWHGGSLSTDQLIRVYDGLAQEFPIYSLEDCLSSEDPAGWRLLKKHFSERIQIAADELCVSHPELIEKAVEEDGITSVVIHPHQLGTITQTLSMVKYCQEYGLNTLVAQKPGGLQDDFLADISVGVSAGQIKAGGFCRAEHLSKYNRLLYIEDRLVQESLDTKS